MKIIVTLCSRWRLLLIAITLSSANLPAAETLVFDQPQLAGIAGFRPYWDVPITLAADGMTAKGEPFKDGDPLRAEWDPAKRKGRPGAMAFDALQRYALVRFPGSAERIAERVTQGSQIAKVELVLPWNATELFPPGNPGYEYRANWGVEDMWRKDPARWHAIAFALRRPWTADEKTGPTFNAFINGAGYWAHCGARDTEQDRFPEQLGPVEVSYKNPEGHLDVTSVVTNTAYGKTLGDRLRGISDCGFVLQKWETYDHRYFNGVYEWGTATGGRAILINTPKLVVTLTPGQAEAVTAGQPVGLAALAEKLRSAGGGKPTAVLPSSEELAAFAAKFAAKPNWMPEWQWQRVQELRNLAGPGKANLPYWYSYAPGHLVNWARERLQSQAGGANIAAALDREVFGIWVDEIIRKQPRGWEGFEASKEMNQWYIYGSTLPRPAKDAILTYWTAWLMPERKAAPLSEHLNPTNTTGQLVHPMADQLAKRGGTESYVGDTYHARTGDWRGNKSFYRSGFNYVMSTQNFNTSAAAGALLGGSIIDSEFAKEDGRYGMEHNLGRLWSWGGGTSQEYIDHYYFAITVSGYKAIADFGPSAFDRLMGETLLMKAMEELSGCYHSGLRRFIAGSSRTSLEYLLGKQDGLQYTLHTESQLGTLTDMGSQKGPFGAPLWGQERSSMDVARQTLNNPWLPEWALNMVDDKPLPYEIYSKTRDTVSRGYLAGHYGLASNNRGDGRIAFMGQWRRDAKQATSFKDIVTMDVRYGINQTRWANDVPGWIAPIGKMASVQHKNKMVVLMSPWPADYIKNVIKKDGLKSLQASIGLFNFQKPSPTWQIFIDGQKVAGLPVKARQGQKITIHDGVAYLAVIPLPGTDLGRQDEVVLREGDWQHFENDPKMQGYQATLVIDSYNLQTASATKDVANWDPIDKSHAGFVVEMGDQTEWGSFENFQQHIGQVSVTTAYDSEKNVDQVTFKSGADTLELGAYTKAESGAPGLIAFQRINSQDATMAEGIDRDTTWTQQSRRGRAEKNGATLTLDAGRLAYLVTEPTLGAYAGFSPLSDLTRYALTTPGGIRVEADGQVGLCRVVVKPKLNAVDIDYSWKPGQSPTPETVKAFLISGCKRIPMVNLNGQPVQAALRQGVYVVPTQP